MKPDFEKGNGLIPAIVQDVKTKDVLMLAYVNEEAYDKMLELKQKEGNYQKKLVSEAYKFEEAGKYIIRYTAYDKNQNYTVVEFTVICK